MFAALGVSPAGHLGPNPYHPSPKVTSVPLDQISTPLYGPSGLLSFINLFLSHQLLQPGPCPLVDNMAPPRLLLKHFKCP